MELAMARLAKPVGLVRRNKSSPISSEPRRAGGHKRLKSLVILYSRF